MLIQSELKKLFTYDPDTGILTRRISISTAKAGDVVGCLDNGYLRVCVKSRLCSVHRVIWVIVYGREPKNYIDHINHVKSDNRLVNLRDVTNQDNQRNQLKSARNTSGITGVYWHKLNKKWSARIQINNKDKHLGLFADKFEAICARKSANNKYGFHSNHGISDLKSILKKKGS